MIQFVESHSVDQSAAVADASGAGGAVAIDSYEKPVRVFLLMVKNYCNILIKNLIKYIDIPKFSAKIF